MVRWIQLIHIQELIAFVKPNLSLKYIINNFFLYFSETNLSFNQVCKLPIQTVTASTIHITTSLQGQTSEDLCQLYSCPAEGHPVPAQALAGVSGCCAHLLYVDVRFDVRVNRLIHVPLTIFFCCFFLISCLFTFLQLDREKYFFFIAKLLKALQYVQML